MTPACDLHKETGRRRQTGDPRGRDYCGAEKHQRLGTMRTRQAHPPPNMEKLGPKEEKDLPKGEISCQRPGQNSNWLWTVASVKSCGVKTPLVCRILCPLFTNNSIAPEGQGRASLPRSLGIRPSECRQTAPSYNTIQGPQTRSGSQRSQRPHHSERGQPSLA